jgi:hypothetical protein
VKAQLCIHCCLVPAQSSVWAVRPSAASARAVAVLAVLESAWAHVGDRSSTPESPKSLSLVSVSGTLRGVFARARFQRSAKATEVLRLVRPAS